MGEREPSGHLSLWTWPSSYNLTRISRSQDHSMTVISSSYLTSQYSLRYWAADHPYVARFRWDQNTWGGSWTFMAASVPLYLFVVFFIKLIFSWRKKPIPLGFLPVFHNLLLLLSSLVMLVGCWQAAVVEIQESQRLWGSSRRALDWLLCFPLGTRPAGRVFFWSYVYYLSKFCELFDTFIIVLRKRRLTFLHLLNHAAAIIMCFCRLQFVESLQVLMIICSTSANAVMYLYLLLHSLGFSPSWKQWVTECQLLQSIFSFLASVGCLRLHFHGGGCAGMASWIFNSFFNVTLLVLFLDFYRKQHAAGISNGFATNTNEKKQQ